jgi:hypothetical protein
MVTVSTWSLRARILFGILEALYGAYLQFVENVRAREHSSPRFLPKRPQRFRRVCNFVIISDQCLPPVQLRKIILYLPWLGFS